MTNRTDFNSFDSRTEVQRRYSEFHTLQKVLTKKGVALPALTRRRWIPTNRSRWEELSDFGELLSELSFKFDENCLKELLRFLQDKAPYWEEEE